MATVGMDIGHSESTWELKHAKGIKTKLHPSGHFEEHWFNSDVSIFAKEILERHGVKVVMAQKPFDNHEVPLRARTDYYDAQNCDLIVSNHANAGVSSADGFSVFYWHNSSSAKRLAEIILKHSKALPIDQFGKGAIPSVPNTWTDFHMCREPKAVSPLIEWGFFTNDHDLRLILDMNFRKQCGLVLAKAILEYLNIPFKEEVKDGWKKDSNGNWTFYKNGELVKNEWAKDSKGKWFFLGSDGVMKSSAWVQWKEKWYFLQEDGEMAADKWIRWKNQWFWVNSEGKMLTGNVEVKGKKYSLRQDGSLIITNDNGEVVE